LDLQFNSLEELPIITKKIIEFGNSQKIWLFEGQMAAGKTTLIKEICKQLGVQNNVGSPTYSLVNEYVTETGKTIYHFDFYRLKNEMEALDYGLEEYFESGNLCLCEWPSKIPNLWSNKYLMVNLKVLNDNTREINLVLKTV
jgi:tRNA threonylcarbamoyladenosine biosynthesis protein TsaE